MKKLIVVGLLVMSQVANAGTMTGAIIGGAVGYAAGKSSAVEVPSQDLVLDTKPGTLVYRSNLFMQENDLWLRQFVGESGYKHYKLNRIIVRTVGSNEHYYYLISAWN